MVLLNRHWFYPDWPNQPNEEWNLQVISAHLWREWNWFWAVTGSVRIPFSFTALKSPCVSLKSIYLITYMAFVGPQLKQKALNLLSVSCGSQHRITKGQTFVERPNIRYNTNKTQSQWFQQRGRTTWASGRTSESDPEMQTAPRWAFSF